MRIFLAALSAVLIMVFLPGAALAQRVVGTITSSGDWSDVALYQTGDKFFVSDYTNNQILVYDAGTLAYLSSIPLSAYSLYGPERLAVHEGTGTLYVSLYRYFPPSSSTIVIINANTYSVIGSLTGFESYAGLFMDESRGRLYVFGGHDTLTAINVNTNTIVGSLDVGHLFSPTGAFVQFEYGNILNPVTGELVFSCAGGDGFVVVDGPSLTGQFITAAGSNGWGGTWNLHENKLYITRTQWNGYFIHDRDTGISKIATSFNDGSSLFYSPATNRVYSGAEVNGDSTVIEGDTDAWQDIEVWGGLSQVGFVAATHHAYFASTSTVRVLDEDTLTVVDTIPGCGFAAVGGTNIVIDQNRRRVFIRSHWNQGDSDPGNSCVQVIDDGPFPAVTSPNGGESLPVGSSYNIIWTNPGTIANVKIDYSTDNGALWTAIVASTPNTHTYPWTVPNTLSAACLVRISDAANPSSNDVSDAVFSIVPLPPAISLSKTSLAFGNVLGGTSTSSQSVIIGNSGGGTLAWTALPSAAWITVAPGSGSGTGTVAIGVDATGLGIGIYSGSVSFSDSNASNSPQAVAVNLTVYAGAGTQPPFGDFAAPIDGTINVTGAIPVTGWVLDDIGVEKVEIWRDPVLAAGELNSLYFIGTGLFVEGARPDIESGYPNYPMSYKAGWGYMLLTNFLPNHGNGTYKLYAIVTDKDGHVFTLGTKTITCDNAHAVKPFGTIDTPGQGGTAGGTFYNFGWVLTPLQGTVPKDGHTITVYVDSVLLGNLSTPPNVYNAYRPDVSNNFPGLNNTGGPLPGQGGPVGAFSLNTTGYANGVHTIHWIAFDDLGRGEGIGSRFFNILNAGSAPGPAPTTETLPEPASDLSMLPLSFKPVKVLTGFDLNAEFQTRLPGADGILRIEIPEVNRLEIDLGEEPEAAAFKPGRARYAGYLRVGNELRPLPVGSTLDRRTGRFSWMPGPGFLGTYDFIFVEFAAASPLRWYRVKTMITPKR